MHEQIIKEFMSHVTSYPKTDQEKIRRAAMLAAEKHGDQKRASGEPYLIHPMSVAKILIQLNSDADTICGGLLHDLIEDTSITLEEIVQQFGLAVGNMVEGATKISTIKAQNKSNQEAETIRKLFLTMPKDIRVIIIKLADKLHNMRTLQFLNQKRAVEIANECLDIYAPLADRLGIAWIKDELQDLSLKMLKPDVYAYIIDYLGSKQLEHEEYTQKIRNILSKKCFEAGFKVQILWRVKHPYSVYMKMKKRNKEIDEIYDLFGIRIICDSVASCYSLLGIIHSLWPPIEGRFKDYIAMPKANNYQSLHTTVMALEGKLMEIQIRTKEMDEIADFGVAAHWAYKSSTGREKGAALATEAYTDIYMRLRNWKNEITQSDSFMDDIKSELLKDSIIVFTPKGNPIDLPVNSTALDFAFKIHTEIGIHTVGAKANGSIIPLSQPLKHTQVIEILTSPNAKPKLAWLKCVNTSSAKRKIRAWLNRNDESLILQKNIIAKPSKEDLEDPKEEQQFADSDIVRSVTNTSKASLVVGKQKNLMISLAQCCNPKPGDDIVGYVSRGRGIIVHRKDCHNLKNMSEINERSIPVEWEAEGQLLVRRFKVTSKRTLDLFSEIEGAIKKYRGHLIEGRLNDTDEGQLVGTFAMECDKEESFSNIMKSIRAIPNIIQISQMYGNQ
ncbi:MAG: RelA/SpoT family protein [Sphaerochaetaceae bacterium]